MTYPDFKDHEPLEGAALCLLISESAAERGKDVVEYLVRKGHCVLTQPETVKELPLKDYYRHQAQLLRMASEVVIFHPKYDDLLRQPFRMELELAEAMQMPVSVFRWKEEMCWTT